MGRGAVGELGEELAERSCHPREAGPVQGDGDPSALRARSALLASRQHTIWSARAATRGLARFALGSSSLAGSLAGTPLSPLARRFDPSFAIVASSRSVCMASRRSSMSATGLSACRARLQARRDRPNNQREGSLTLQGPGRALFPEAITGGFGLPKWSLQTVKPEGR